VLPESRREQPASRPSVRPSFLFVLHRLRNTISLTRVDSLASLLDLLQHGSVVQVLVGCDGSGLAFEGDVEGLDAWEGGGGCALARYCPVLYCMKAGVGLTGIVVATADCDLPSSFFSTRSTAPEQPPQVMVMLNL